MTRTLSEHGIKVELPPDMGAAANVFNTVFTSLPVSVVIIYLIYRSVTSGFAIDFHLPWKAMAIAAVSMFSVVFSTMMYSMNKIKKDNPIDALKYENL